ncbi:efflux RND transporter periplasmic adaptor subunit [Mesoterricola sediminis]|uniref:RND transporter n=1 Tax=Mesoterricola sediminis TaxID=2927980 RepID=A0AA48KF10_9BACT|nr:HlyD family efflux transporter periplasmic adaptor subunit [Mesoterricola sediminis]BDU78590.1 RND transporter [Mesoterricola sediminis]
MDFARTPQPNRKKALALGGAGLGVVLLTVGLARLKPAVPVVERPSILVDTVKRGPMVFQVRGTGTLQPVEVRWIATSFDSRVEKIHVWPGTPVKADTVILELSNPELQQAALDAQWQYRAAEGEYTSAKARVQEALLDKRAALATVKAGNLDARMDLEAKEILARDGYVARHVVLQARGRAEELSTRYQIEQDRLKLGEASLGAQLAASQAKVEQAKALWLLKQSQVAALKVRAGLTGVLQALQAQVGQRLAPGASLARVAEPTRLKAELRISETQAKDIVVGQPVAVDTRNGVVQGRVIRIDPAVVNGTVTVDASLEGPLPKGARPDLSVEGIVELDRAADGVFVGRPVQAQPYGTVSLYRLAPGGAEATRVTVRLGRGSVSTIEVLDGLKPGDQVILSDTSAWDASDRIRIK